MGEPRSSSCRLPPAHDARSPQAANRDRAGLPDVQADDVGERAVHLDRVGMAGIEAMAVLDDGRRVPARVDATVSLDDEHARGIHMSRLYLDCQDRLEHQPLSLDLAADLVTDFVASQEGRAHSAEVAVHVVWPILRPALESEHAGWRHYPVTIGARLEGGRVTRTLDLRVVYSSTCPCSAALSRRATQEAFDAAFGGGETGDADAVRAWLGSEAGMPATPHSQRSEARLELVPAQGVQLPELVTIIDRAEQVLATPVQTAVKRGDEQAFARRNAGNLMFCEDAVRRLRDLAEALPGVADYRIRVAHRESLHPHDAVASGVRGLRDGLRA